MIGSVYKALQILEAFTVEQPLMSLSLISKKLGYPKTTVFTLLKTLEAKGYIEQIDQGTYCLGTAPLLLTQTVRVNVQIRDRSAPVLRRLADRTNQTVYLGIPDGGYCLYLYAIETSQRLMARSAVGMRMPFGCSALGKAMLAFLADTSLVPELPGNRVLEEELVQTKANGYAIDDAVLVPGIHCVAVPILDQAGKSVASVSLSGNSARLVHEELGIYLSYLREAAGEIRCLLGYIPSLL
ncbi:MAG: IclR family transcriptional regulator [Sphaerochaeta sp.]|jgi:DNA-binding IclR family transcriptional regulator|uniref:IclR family transcriptional regulator n=1 Tax=Sphaerochaeta sp. TaxID=1972642 RepID=UPI002FCC9715